MNWVLWREYRLNRWILFLGAVSLVLPYVTAALICLVNPVIDGVVPSATEILGGAILGSFVATQVAFAILGGNSIAGERADRSAEFMAYLPVSRTRRLRSKLTIACSFVAVSWGVSVLAIGILLLADSEMAGLRLQDFPTIVLAALFSAALSLATYALCWLISSYTNNPALAVAVGLMTAIIVAFIAAICAEESESNVHFLLTGYTIASLTVGGVCFWTGTRYYLNRAEP